MTITAQYEPLKVPTPVTASYFAFENVGPESIEVWLETETVTPGVYTRTRLPPTQYSIYMAGAAPFYTGGLIAFADGVIPDTVDQVSIERNTLIVQTCDFSNFSPFHMELIEFTLDKLTMIIQEIAERKCNVDLGPTDITQELTFGPQDVLYTSMLDFALNKINDYCLLIVATGDDCTENPGGA